MMKNRETFTITDETNGNFSYEELPFNRIKEDVLSEEYNLSLVFIGEKQSQKLNKEYRKKDYPTNILSFPLDEGSGEIFICIPKAEEEARSYGRDTAHFILYLFIHGLFHLKGFEHGKEMEKEEKQIREKYEV